MLSCALPRQDSSGRRLPAAPVPVMPQRIYSTTSSFQKRHLLSKMMLHHEDSPLLMTPCPARARDLMMGTNGWSELPVTIDPELQRVNARLFQAPDFKVRWIGAAALQRDIRVRQRLRIRLKNLAAVLNVSLTIVPSLDLDPVKV